MMPSVGLDWALLASLILVARGSRLPDFQLNEDIFVLPQTDDSMPVTGRPDLDPGDVLPDLSARSQACDLLVGIDERLWEEHDRDLEALVGLVQNHVSYANQVFAQQVLTAETGFPDVYFRLARVQIIHGSCQNFQDQNCTSHRDEYLRTFGDSYFFHDFCLAYVFTYLDFHNGTAGLAYVGTACYHHSAANIKSQNIGFVTLLNYGQNRTLEDSRRTFVHELAHNFGAKHDNEEENDKECQNQGYIMDESDLVEGENGTFVEGPEKNSEIFSPCSIAAMKAKLNEIHEDRQCYKDEYYDPDHRPVIAICGNGIVEDGEQCDCGQHFERCHDACCYSANISPEDRALNISAVPCSRNERPECVHPTGLVFGVYVPLTVMLLAVLFMGACLVSDWKGQKRYFTHITQGNIRIVK